MSWRIYPVASCFWLWGETLEKTLCTLNCWLMLPSFLLRSLLSFVPSSTRSSLMSSLTRWWSRWFQHLSVVRQKYMAQRRPSLASWCSKKSTTRSSCARGWWSGWFHWNLQLLSQSSDQEFVPEPCPLRAVWSLSLFSHCCFGQCEHPHQLIFLLLLLLLLVTCESDQCESGLTGYGCVSVMPVGDGHKPVRPLERWAMLNSLPCRFILAVWVLESRFSCWRRFLRIK